MKKNILVFGTMLLLAVGFTSCGNKCVECANCPDEISLLDANDNEVEVMEYCEEDFDSKEDYDQAVSLIEGLGCECK